MILGWTSKEAQKRIPERNAEWLRVNSHFYNGDHWQGGKGWVGPTLPKGHAKHAATMQSIQSIFVSKNMVASVVDNHAQGVVGRAPHWSVRPRRAMQPDEVPTSEEEAILREAEALIETWLDDLNGIVYRDGSETEIRPCSPFGTVETATKQALLSRRGTLRFVVSPKALEQSQFDESSIQVQVPEMPAEEIAKLIHIQATNPTQATVFFDPDKLEPIGIFTYEEKDEDGEELMAELTFLAEDGETVLQLVNEDGQPDSSQTTTLALDGHLTHYEFELPLFITTQVQQAQKALNKAKTMESKNLDTGGFLERVILNAQAPGHWEKDPQTGEETFMPQTLEIGPGLTTFLEGVEQERADGSVTHASPSVIYRDPTSPEAFIQSSEDLERDILMQCDQLHRAMEGNSQVSGVSRVQAKDTFRQSLGKTKNEADKAIAWMLETFLALTAALSGQPGRYANLRIIGNAQLDLGVVTQEEHTQNLAAFAVGLQSRETTMANIGIEDVEAEMARLNDTMGGTNATDKDDEGDDEASESDDMQDG